MSFLGKGYPNDWSQVPSRWVLQSQVGEYPSPRQGLLSPRYRDPSQDRTGYHPSSQDRNGVSPSQDWGTPSQDRLHLHRLCRGWFISCSFLQEECLVVLLHILADPYFGCIHTHVFCCRRIILFGGEFCSQSDLIVGAEGVGQWLCGR